MSSARWRRRSTWCRIAEINGRLILVLCLSPRLPNMSYHSSMCAAWFIQFGHAIGEKCMRRNGGFTVSPDRECEGLLPDCVDSYRPPQYQNIASIRGSG